MKFKYYFLAVIILIGLSVNAQQRKEIKANDSRVKIIDTTIQETGKSGKKLEKELKEHDNNAREYEQEKGENKGNAYGRNKGELEGRDFGQERARQAKLAQKEKVEILEKTISEKENKIKEAKDKIKKYKEKLNKDKDKKTISDREYNERNEKIEKAEKALEDLEGNIKKGKELDKNIEKDKN